MKRFRVTILHQRLEHFDVVAVDKSDARTRVGLWRENSKDARLGGSVTPIVISLLDPTGDVVEIK
jgi:hypothetical protein